MKTTKLFGAIFAIAVISCCGDDPTDPCKNVSCGEHGTCQSGQCNCDLGYSGDSCETLNCPADKCPAYQECREADGVCVGNDPCDPSPCNGYGTCTCIGIGQAECTCITGYDGQTCSLCAEGFTGYPTCLEDLCYGIICDDDGNLCNGDEECNPLTGTCHSVSPLTCDDGLACNGVETCIPVTGCTNPADVDCNSHGICAETPVAGVCDCSTGYDPNQNCGTCLPTHEGYPNCVPDVTPPADPVITTNGGNPWDPGQADITIEGTCDGSDTNKMQVKDGAGGTWENIASYTPGSDTWSWNTTVGTDELHYFYFRSTDAANNHSNENAIEVLWSP